MDSFVRLKIQLNRYIKKYPFPSKNENLERFKTLHVLRENLPDNQEEYDNLRNILILSNGGFAMKYAITYCKKLNNSDIIDDLFQQAQMGIIEAIDRFDVYRGVNFTTFAYHYVKKCLIDYIKKNKVISVNRNIARFIKHITDIKEELTMNNNGFEPTVEEIQNVLLNRNIELKREIIIQLLTLIELNSMSDSSFTTNNIDDLSNDNTFAALLEFQTNILNELKYIPIEYLNIIKMRFGIGYDRPYDLQELKYIYNLDDEFINNLMYYVKTYID